MSKVSNEKTYVPHILPYEDLDWKRLSIYIGKANAILSQYSELVKAMINPYILLSPLTTQEATVSSRIEGTQATLSEVLLYEVGNEYQEKKGRDINEIINYRKALLEAKILLKKRPFIHLNMINNYILFY